jgi:hypothetical protein
MAENHDWQTDRLVPHSDRQSLDFNIYYWTAVSVTGGYGINKLRLCDDLLTDGRL